ncbi:hypothetical protein TSOC_002032 [Tetrabaena socialis]|uniref:Uncharacterized protein n=1 Tax=Tetrabaena socialis TaxID=47790 RepID=A0A2J8AF82_9CHLO|nr:hypothetical protein TSOC_002032 [Tetrabaena socialis]|eukprot:PNH11156.1 hypothetical protein TSOC_002032 [Tetrabaena socialis]
MDTLEDMRSSHQCGRLHQNLVQTVGKFTSLVELVGLQSAVLHELVRRSIVLAGTRDYVADFRFHIYMHIVEGDPGFGQRYSFAGFLSALQDEVFYSAVERLGLSAAEWQQLKVLSTDSGAFTCHRKFTLQELESEVFPPDLAPCRPILLKAARKMLELNKAAEGQAAEPSQDPIDNADFF